MKYVISILLFVAGSVWADVPKGDQPVTDDVENRAVIVKFMGGFTGFDADAYRMVRGGIASLLAEGIVDQFITTSWGFEGGNDFCVELNPDPMFKIERVINMLAAVKPANQTVFHYTAVVSCSAAQQ